MKEPPRPVPLATSERFVWFFDEIWRMFIKGTAVDAVTLIDTLEKSGLVTWERANLAMVERSNTGIVEGDVLLALTPKAIEMIRQMSPTETPIPHR